MQLSEFQNIIKNTYGQKDQKRGVDKTFMWFMEEIGELARELHRENDKKRLSHEFADCFAWLVTLANLKGIDIEKAVEKYKDGCYRCQSIPCLCKEPTTLQ